MRGDFTKNVYFGFGEKDRWFKAVTLFHVYFCIPARKGWSRKIKGLAENMSTFVYLSRLVCTGFVWNQRVDRHGGVTKVDKNGPEVG